MIFNNHPTALHDFPYSRAYRQSKARQGKAKQGLIPSPPYPAHHPKPHTG